MARATYREIECKSALNRVQGMPFRWSLNPYRGCAHHCHYCYASATHKFYDLAGAADFFGIVFVKTNLPEVLAEEVSRRSWKREQVAVGTATDPYQPAEGRYRLTRRCLEVFVRFRTPISLVTKGTMVLRDLDLLQELTRRAGATVCFSVPTVDPQIWRKTELGTPPPWQRLRVLERLVAGGVRAGVLLAPLLPGLSARPEQIARTVRAAADHGARFIGDGLLHLDAGIREYFLDFLAREYPQLLDGYQRLYGTKYAPRAYQARVERRVQEARALAGYAQEHHRRVEAPPEPAEPRQLMLPLLAVSR
jgi:DNA repair photolyase